MIVDLFNKVFKDIWPMLTVFIVSLSLIRFFYLQNHREKFCFYKEVLFLIAIIYFWVLFKVLTITEINSNSGMNLVPFSEITRYRFGTTMFNYNVFGNILIFIPFGYFIGHYVNPKKIWPVIITSLITGITVELVQLRIGRSFDIDDILLNLFGSILGYLLYIGLSAINKKLPDVLKSDLVYNIITIVLLLLFGIYIFGYWGVVFK